MSLSFSLYTPPTNFSSHPSEPSTNSSTVTVQRYAFALRFLRFFRSPLREATVLKPAMSTQPSPPPALSQPPTQPTPTPTTATAPLSSSSAPISAPTQDSNNLPQPSSTVLTTATIPSIPTTNPDGTPLSKNQLKKAARKARHLATRDTWKAQKRAKAQARKARKREEKRALLDSADGDDDHLPATKRQKRIQHEIVDTTLVLDCGFDELMTENEIVSMASQLTRCYASNKAAEKQFKLVVTRFDGRLRNRFETVLANTHKHWKNIAFSDQEYEPGDDVVYLTADSEHTITELQEGTRYVIGGIVDRNRYKNLCRDKAQKQGVKTGRLPIGEYIKMASRQVLTTNQVVEIMIGWLQHRDWEKAFVDVIPKRKGGVVKKEAEENVAEGNGEEDEEGEYEDEGEREAEEEGGKYQGEDDGNVNEETKEGEAEDIIMGEGGRVPRNEILRNANEKADDVDGNTVAIAADDQRSTAQ